MRSNHQHSNHVSEEVLDDLLEEIAAKFERGEPVDVDAYIRDYPEQADQLQKMLPAMQVLKDAARSASSPSEASILSNAAEAANGTLGDFRILREVGRGGMGVVYEAQQISLSRTVALKVLPFAATMDRRQLQRFKNESLAAAHLEHPNIVDVYGVGCERGVHYYAMRFIDGPTLSDVIGQLRERVQQRTDLPESIDEIVVEAESGKRAEGDPSPAEATRDYTPAPGDEPERAAETHADAQALLSTKKSAFGLAYFRSVVEVGMQVAEALEQAHEEGIIHRDVKPSNLMLDSRGKVWVTDFGLAHVESSGTLTMSGDLVGTLRYMSPEQALAKKVPLDHRTDIYSLGVTLYELLTLQPAFAGENRQELLRQIAEEEPKAPRTLNKSILADLETIVLKAISKEPSERYATAQEMADDLRRFLNDQPIRARPPSLSQHVRKWTRRHQALVWSTAAVLLISILILGGAIGWVARDEAARQTIAAAKVKQSLKEVERLEKESRWSEALAVAKHARFLLNSAGGNEVLRQQVQQQVDDLILLQQIEEIYLQKAKLNPVNEEFAVKSVQPEFRKAFAHWGLGVGKIAPEQAAARIRKLPTPIRDALLAALYDWQWDIDNGSPKAQWLLQVISQIDPDPWRAKVHRAKAQRDLVALKRLINEMDTTRQPPTFLAHLGMCLITSEEAGAAVKLLAKAHEQHPQDFWVNHNLGVALICTHQPEKAIRYLWAAQSLKPSPAVYLNLGLALFRNNEPDEAEAAYREALALHPNYGDAHYNLGMLYDERGNHEKASECYRKAAECYRKALQLGGPFLEGYTKLATALRSQGELDEAITQYKKAIELSPQYAKAFAGLGRAYLAKKQYDQAIEAFKEAIEIDPQFVTAHIRLAQALQEKGCLQKSIDVLQKAVQTKPEDSRIYHTLANSFFKDNQLSKAVAALKKVLRLNPADARGYRNLGFVLSRQGRLDEAIGFYRMAIFQDPEYVLAHCNLAKALVEKGYIQEAVDTWKKATQSANFRFYDEKARVYYNLGKALVQRGNLQEGTDAYRKALKLNANDPETWCNLGHALRDKGHFQDALKHLRHGHQLGTKQREWGYPSAQWIQECQRVVSIAKRLEKQRCDNELPLDRVFKGRLTKDDPLDPAREQCYHKAHTVKLQAGKVYRIDLVSPDFDTFLRLEDVSTGQGATYDDTSHQDRNSFCVLHPDQAGAYRLVVTSSQPAKIGRYFLGIQEFVPTSKPQVLKGTLSKTSPLWKGRHHVVHWVKAKTDMAYLIELESSDFDPLLLVKNAEGKMIGADDDSGEGLNSCVLLSAPVDCQMQLVAVALRPGTTGEYTLRIQPHAAPQKDNGKDTKSDKE